MQKDKKIRPTTVQLKKTKHSLTKVEILETKYNDLGYLFILVEQADNEIEEILEEIQSVGFGC